MSRSCKGYSLLPIKSSEWGGASFCTRASIGYKSTKIVFSFKLMASGGGCHRMRQRKGLLQLRIIGLYPRLCFLIRCAVLIGDPMAPNSVASWASSTCHHHERQEIVKKPGAWQASSGAHGRGRCSLPCYDESKVLLMIRTAC